MREEGSATRALIKRYFSAQGYNSEELPIVMELGSFEAIKSAIEAGRGVSLLPRIAVEKEIRLGALHALALQPILSRSIVFIHKDQKFPLRAVQELISFAHQNVGKADAAVMHPGILESV